MTNLETTIATELKKSMLAKNTIRIQALRGIKSQFGILNSSGEMVTEELQLKALQKMVKQRKDSAEIYKTNDRMELYEIEMSEIAIIEEFLPKQLSIDEIRAEVLSIITELGVTNIKEMGKVIGFATKKLAGKADGKTISEIVKESLS